MHPAGEPCECDADDCECTEEILRTLVGTFGDNIEVYNLSATPEQANTAMLSLQAAFEKQYESTKNQLNRRVKEVNITGDEDNNVYKDEEDAEKIVGYFGYLHKNGDNFISMMVGYLSKNNMTQMKSNSDIRLATMPRQFITPKQLLGLEKRFNAVKQMAVANRRFMFQPQRMS